MGTGASLGVREAIQACTKSELKCILPRSGEEFQKITAALKELAEERFVEDNEYEGRLRIIFNECDKDSNGDLDLDELKQALERDENMAKEYGLSGVLSRNHINQKDEIVKLFKDADKDSDGSLSWQEFRRLMVRLRQGEFNLHDYVANCVPLSARSRRSSSSSIPPIVCKSATLADLEFSARADVNEWRIDYWELDAKEQSMILLQGIKVWYCLNELRVPKNVLHDFMSAIKDRYLDNPYHNFLHALATVHYSYRLAEASGIIELLTAKDRFALLMGALCHDVGHTGRVNAFEILTCSPLALRYNDRSPLENHHCAIAFEVALLEPDMALTRQGSKHSTSSNSTLNCNIFKEFDQATFTVVRRRMIAGILGTDMSIHNDHVKKLVASSSPSEVGEIDGGEFLATMLLHAADIGNPLMPVDISHRWGLKIAEEFTAQVQEEAKLGLPVTAFMSGLSDPKKNAKSRVGFMEFVVTPMASRLFELWPGLVKDAKRHLDENREADRLKAAS